jgi:hypothetical protein
MRKRFDNDSDGKRKPRTNRNGSPYGKGSNFHGKGRAEGGKTGIHYKDNAFAMRHGMRAGKLPKGCEYIEVRCNLLRRDVENAVLELKGEINLLDAAAINSILKWERHGLLAAHWLRMEIDSLSASDRLRFSEAMAKASERRDQNIRMLGLDIEPEPIDLNAYLADGKGRSNGRLPYGLKELPQEPKDSEDEGSEDGEPEHELEPPDNDATSLSESGHSGGSGHSSESESADDEDAEDEESEP